MSLKIRKNKRTAPSLENLGSLITYDDKGTSRCLGYLITHEAKVYDATFGKVDVSLEDAEKHNNCLSKAQIAGLDACEIGQCGDFYIDKRDNLPTSPGFKTWQGEVLTAPGTTSKVKRNTYEFIRNGKRYEATTSVDADTVFIKRLT